MIIGLSGYAQSGKNTVANILVDHHGFIALAFADPIKELVYDINPKINSIEIQGLVNEYGWDIVKQDPEVRRLLQTTGEAGRQGIDEYLWVAMTLSQIKDPHEGRYVITDVRFPNEAAAITAQGGQLWRIERQGVDAVNDHISETALDAWVFDETIINNGTIEELKKKISVDL
jgi:hypothetical protein